MAALFFWFSYLYTTTSFFQTGTYMLKICHDDGHYILPDFGTMHLCVQWRWSRVASFFLKVCLSEAQGCQQNCSHHWSKLSLWALPSAVRKVVIEIELNIQNK